MRTVWKYTLTVQGDPINVAVPHGAEYLDAQPSTTGKLDDIDVWFKVDTDQQRVDHLVFVTRGTGHPVPEAANVYRATIKAGIGSLALVWHLFEVA